MFHRGLPARTGSDNGAGGAFNNEAKKLKYPD
jgi:hypothetical protein